MSGDASGDAIQIQKPATAKFLDGMTDPETLPAWLTEEDLDYYVAQYEQSGFLGPINWYRNIDRNLDLTPQLASAKIERPTIFIARDKEPVLSFGSGGWVDLMDHFTTDLRGKIDIDGAGHWVQMETPKEVNEALIGFLEQFA